MHDLSVPMHEQGESRQAHPPGAQEGEAVRVPRVSKAVRAEGAPERAHERSAPQGQALPLRRVRLLGGHQRPRAQARPDCSQEGETVRLRDLQLQIRSKGETPAWWLWVCISLISGSSARYA